MRRETGWSPMEKLRFSAYSRVEGVVDEPDVRPEYCISELLYVSQITQRHKGKRRHREKPALQGSFEAGFSLCLRAFVSLCYLRYVSVFTKMGSSRSQDRIFLLALNEHLIDTVLIHIDNLEMKTLCFESVRGDGNSSHLSHHKTAESVIAASFFARKFRQIHQLLEVVNGHLSVHKPRSIGTLHGMPLLKHGGGSHLPDQVLKEIIERDKPFHVAILVDNERNTCMRCLEHFEQPECWNCSRHEERRARCIF